MRTQLINHLYLGAGALLGAFLRYWISALTLFLWGGTIWATLFVNWLGSFALGFLASALGPYFGNFSHIRLFFVVGLLGSFTTFSAFSFDILNLFQKKLVASALLYLLSSVLGGAGLAYLGWYWGAK